jgi:hypothetical protein
MYCLQHQCNALTTTVETALCCVDAQCATNMPKPLSIVGVYYANERLNDDRYVKDAFGAVCAVAVSMRTLRVCVRALPTTPRRCRTACVCAWTTAPSATPTIKRHRARDTVCMFAMLHRLVVPAVVIAVYVDLRMGATGFVIVVYLRLKYYYPKNSKIRF